MGTRICVAAAKPSRGAVMLALKQEATELVQRKRDCDSARTDAAITVSGDTAVRSDRPPQAIPEEAVPEFPRHLGSRTQPSPA